MRPTHGVHLTRGAEADLADIHRRIAGERGGEGADAFLDRLTGRLDRLDTFPLRGQIVPELEPLGMNEFRQIVVEPYRVVYRVMGDTVFVLVIAHGRRDFRSLLERRLLNG